MEEPINVRRRKIAIVFLILSIPFGLFALLATFISGPPWPIRTRTAVPTPGSFAT